LDGDPQIRETGQATDGHDQEPEMNPRLNFLFSRRSIRTYRQQDVPDGLVRDLLEAAMAAPSAVAKDPWAFVLVRNRRMLSKIAEGLPNGTMLRDAAFGIVVCGDLQRVHDRQLSYLLQDCSAAIENLLLAANGLGLGACWLGVHPREERVKHIRSLLNIPDPVIPVAAIAVGWPAESPDPRTRYREDAVHHETW
jgi:nitroreductase